MKRKYSIIILVMIVSLGSMLLVPKIFANSLPLAQEGVITYVEKTEKQVIPLNGEWEFYWKKLYTPDDFQLQSTLNTTAQLVNLPHKAQGYEIDGQLLSLTGYATYRLHMKFPATEIGTTKALHVPSISTAYTLWIDGEVQVSNGVVGKSRESMVPESTPQIVQFQVNSPSMEIVIQASNYYQRKAGIYDSILIGEPGDIFQYQNKRIVFRTTIVISLVMMGLYHLSLFSFRRTEYSLIYFGFLCFLIAIRTTLLEEWLAIYLSPYLPWELANKLEYLGASLGVLFFSLFTYSQFSEDMSRKAKKIIMFAMVGYSLFIIVTPAIVFTQTMIQLQILILCIFLYLFYVYFLAFKRKREGSVLNIFAMIFLFVGAINDVSFYNDIVNTMELTSVGMLFFLFTQSMMLSKKSALAFRKSEKLSRELTVLNTVLEQKVQKRTEELNKSNHQLLEMNEKLNEAHQSRSRLISNIVHEIATPLTSIQAYTKGLLDGVVQNDQKYYQLIYDKSLYITRMLHDLRAMTDIETKQIKFSLKKENIAEFIRNVYHKYGFEIEKQGITFRFENKLLTVEEELFVLIDSMRMEQVLVNLLSNAQRFVEYDGKITLSIEQQEPHSVWIKVKDNGLGIREEELPFVFDRFYSNRQKGKQHNGSGLGLSISKEIVEYHNGMIGVESEAGEGSCFYIILPLLKEEQ